MTNESCDANKDLDTPTYENMSGKLTSDQVLQIANDRIERRAKDKALQAAAAQQDCKDATDILKRLELCGITPPSVGNTPFSEPITLDDSRKKNIIPDPNTWLWPDSVIQPPMKELRFSK